MDKNKNSTDMKNINEIIDAVKSKTITANDAKEQVLILFNVSVSSLSELDKIMLDGINQSIDTIELLVTN